MRHIASLIAGLVVAPLTWVLLAYGQSANAAALADWQNSGSSGTPHIVQAAIFLAVAGICVGLLATLRISPAGPILAAVILLAGPVGLLINAKVTQDAVPADFTISGHTFHLTAPLTNGTLPVLGMALLMAVFSAARWRDKVTPGPVIDHVPAPREAADAGEAGGDEVIGESRPAEPTGDDAAEHADAADATADSTGGEGTPESTGESAPGTDSPAAETAPDTAR